MTTNRNRLLGATALSPESLAVLTEEDISVLGDFFAEEKARLAALAARLDAIGPREKGVTDRVYEMLSDYRSGHELLMLELAEQLTRTIRLARLAEGRAAQ